MRANCTNYRRMRIVKTTNKGLYQIRTYQTQAPTDRADVVQIGLRGHLKCGWVGRHEVQAITKRYFLLKTKKNANITSFFVCLFENLKIQKTNVVYKPSEIYLSENNHL